MREYQPNSHKSKEETAVSESKSERKIRKVVNGNVKTKKNSGRKLANVFISEEAANVKSYVFMDVLVPAIKKAISDIVTDGIDMILYGESRDRKNKSTNKVSYRSYYDEGRRSDRRDSSYRSSGRFDYDDLEFDTRSEAEAVREEMLDVIDRYGFVTVADMYDMADLSAPYTSSKYGWTNIRSAEVVRVRNGYVLKLPKAMPID